ncbi:MAG: hypothetical protein RJA87_1443 [Pseudomonadota bacterium]
MPLLRSVLAVIVLLLWAGLSTPSVARTSADAQFKAIYETEWAWRDAQLIADSWDGPIRDRMPQIDEKTQAARLAYWEATLAKLSKVRVDQLSAKARADYGVYRLQITTLANSQRFKDYEAPFNSDSAFWSEMASTARKPFKTVEDYHKFIAQMQTWPAYFEQSEANMRAGLARGFTPPKVTLLGREASVAVVAEATSPTDTVFYQPFKTLPAGLSASEEEALRAQAITVIRDQVIPAHMKLLAFLKDDYLPKATETLAAESLPNGKAYYQAKILEYATLELTPDQIHKIGLEQVDLISAQMQAVMVETGFQGDMPAFLAFLRKDPRFYVKTPQELLDRAAWVAKQFDGRADRWFGHLPRSRFAITPVPDEIAPYYTAGRGGPGVYLLNTYDLPSRPLYALTALTLHESAPGHAFQVPLASENREQPAFRRQTYISAFGEGWALYCEKLGVEMGMYETPYDRFGMLSYQMWRAARLVVDTGIHSKGWTRDQARAYLLSHTALSEREVNTEVDRYISWPGQALAYYLGQMAIEKGRAKAETALGSRFNIRAFHDTVLSLGSVPLPVLTDRIDQFIAEGGVGPYPDAE